MKTVLDLHNRDINPAHDFQVKRNEFFTKIIVHDRTDVDTTVSLTIDNNVMDDIVEAILKHKETI